LGAIFMGDGGLGIAASYLLGLAVMLLLTFPAMDGGMQAIFLRAFLTPLVLAVIWVCGWLLIGPEHEALPAAVLSCTGALASYVLALLLLRGIELEEVTKVLRLFRGAVRTWGAESVG
jgi:hypothetical protein